ncbi:MAG: hypothetical protein D6737_15410 [Chloroflexi bacterium]|nr:MAG: hypothetical protein D6737_15410 [Chloroflexota bacterium]
MRVTTLKHAIIHRGAVPHLAVYLLYLAVTLIITWPLVRVFSTDFVGHRFGDQTELARHIWWIGHALRNGEPLFFEQPLLAYPDGLNGAWLWGNPLQSFPAWLFAYIMPLPAAFNLMTVLRVALNGWAMYVLALYLTGGKRGPSLLAGLIFMTAPTLQGQLAAGHQGILVMWPLPLYSYGLLRLRESSERRWVVLAAAMFTVSVWGSNLHLFFLVAPLSMMFVLMMLKDRRWQALRRMLGAMVVGGLAALIFVIPVAAQQVNLPERLREGGIVTFSADVLSLVTPSFQHPLFGQLTYTHRVLGVNVTEAAGYVGLVTFVLVIIAVWKERAARWWLGLLIVVWIFSLGPLLKAFDQPVTFTAGQFESFIALPWAVAQNFPLLNVMRTPGRFNLTIALALAIMSAYGASYVWAWFEQKRGGVLRWLVFILAMAFVVWEYQVFWPMPTYNAVIPQAIHDLRQRDDIRAVFDMPWQHLLVDKDALYLQTAHQQPLIAGHVTRRTPVDPAKLTLLQATLDPALLDSAGVDIIILHKEWDDEDGLLDAFAREQLGDPIFENDALAMWEAPPGDSAPQFTTWTPDDAIRTSVDAYLYAPRSGWATLSGQLEADDREVTLLLDDEALHTWAIDGTTNIRVALPLADAGYHTVTLAVNPPCPRIVNETLRCNSVQIDTLIIDDYAPDDTAAAIRFDKGLTLNDAFVSQANAAIDVYLWWGFEAARDMNDVRFVHVVDADGNLVTQEDGTLGEQAADSQWVEAISLSLPDDASGEYRVYTGWYTYPDIARFAVLDDVPGAGDGWVLLGTICVGEECE